MKKQKELLEKLKAGKKIAPRHINSISVGNIIKVVDPSLLELYNVLESLVLPIDISYDKDEKGNEAMSIGGYQIIPSEDTTWKWSVIGNSAGGFLRAFDAVLYIFNLEMARLITEKLKG
jgi:hypothetical protein